MNRSSNAGSRSRKTRSKAASTLSLCRRTPKWRGSLWSAPAERSVDGALDKAFMASMRGVHLWEVATFHEPARRVSRPLGTVPHRRDPRRGPTRVRLSNFSRPLRDACHLNTVDEDKHSTVVNETVSSRSRPYPRRGWTRVPVGARRAPEGRRSQVMARDR